MKRSSPLWGSVSVLIGVVIAILALVRGAWLVPLLLLVFTAWGLWVVMFQLQPAWDSIRGYRKKAHDVRKQREASLYSTAQANADAMQLLLRHVNHRISAYLKSVYPSARWEWTTGNLTALIMQGGTGRIRVYGIEEYDYADVQIDRNGNLSCNLLKVVPVQPRIMQYTDNEAALIGGLISNYFLRPAVSAALKDSYIHVLEHLRAGRVSAADLKQIQKALTFLMPTCQMSREAQRDLMGASLKTTALLSSCR